MQKKSAVKMEKGYRSFAVFNGVFLVLVAFICVVPVINVLAISLSSSTAALGGKVTFWPVDFTVDAYRAIIFRDNVFIKSFLIAVVRVVMGTSLGMLVVIISAYALAKDSKYFKARSFYVWFFFFTTLFSGGLIPGFIVVFYTGLYNNLWSLIIPSLVNVWNIVLMLNYLRSLPKELEEAAIVDGAGHWLLLWKIIVPLSTPIIATCALFTIVGHWNDFFTPMLYLKQENWPLQSYLNSILTVDVARFRQVTGGTTEMDFSALAPKTLKAAMIFLAMIPVLLIYIPLQKYFTQGLVLGSVKG